MRRYCPLLLALALLPLTFTTPAFAGSFEVIASSGDPSPDANGDILTFTTPALNDAGQVAFLSQLANTANFELDDVVLFRGSESGLTIVAREGVTDLDGEPISTFLSNSPSIIASGTVSHFADRASAPGKQVAFLGSGGPLDSYLEVGSSSPTGMNQLVSHTVPVINSSGTAAYRAFYGGTNIETGIYSRTSAGATTLRFKEGDYGASEYIVFLQTLPTLNETGQIAIAASVDDGFATRKVVIRLDGTTVHELARDGSLTTNGVTTINNVLSTAVPINSAGQIAFEALYTQAGVTQRPGVFLVNNGSRTLLTPHTLPGAATAATNLRVTSLNNAGTASFTSEFTGTGDLASGVYLSNTGGTTLVAFEDTQTPDGEKYFRRFLTESLALNQDGQLAFLADLSNTANGSSAGNGLFLYDPTEGLQQILRVGEAFEGSTIAGLNFVGDYYTAHQSASSRQAPDSDFSGLNSSGQLAFTFSLANGQGGVAIWSPDAGALDGDYNSDGMVDAADYTVWRNRLGQSFTLDNEKPDPATPGFVDQEDYLFWKTNYGNSASGAGGGSISVVGGGSVVPEPASGLLALFASLVLALGRRSGRSRTC